MIEVFGRDSSYKVFHRLLYHLINNQVKIVDLGNACWTFKHFTADVQTRQYRSPEVILGYEYDESIDVWSMACIVFELLTGDLMFEPKSGKKFSKNDGTHSTTCSIIDINKLDHLAQMAELIGRFPTKFAIGGRSSSKYFTHKGEHRNIRKLKFWDLRAVFKDKYHFSEVDASEISSFLQPMLELCPTRRATANECLSHKWIKNIDINDFESLFK